MSATGELCEEPAPSSAAGSGASARARGADGLRERLEAFRAELAELAFALDSRGRADAADVASGAAARLGELCAEFDQASGGNSLATASRR